MKKEYLTERSFSILLKEIASLISANNHTEARLEIAEFFDLTYYQKIFQSIQIICDVYGSLPAEISTFRERMTNNMLLHIASEYGLEISREIKSKL